MASAGDAPPAAPPVSMGFALLRGASKPRATLPVQGGGGGEARDFVVAMGDGALASAAPKAAAAALIIPAQPNTFETGKGKRRGVRARAAPRPRRPDAHAAPAEACVRARQCSAAPQP
jgi:hypothetical protein